MNGWVVEVWAIGRMGSRCVQQEMVDLGLNILSSEFQNDYMCYTPITN